MSTLRQKLSYEPEVLEFGTSGRRGKVVDLTQLEIYINATAELEYLQSLSSEEGGIRKGDIFYFAYDLRPSSTKYVPEEKGRGEIAQAIQRAIQDSGMVPVNLGEIPTPALTFYALEQGRGSMMITGSHIPFDRNGYKTNSAKGELLKKEETPINQHVEELRERIYCQPFEQSLFNEQGLFKSGHQDLIPVDGAGRTAYIRRYTDFFAFRSLEGKQLVVYQHSAVGRDILVEILEQLGAKAIPAGRSEFFVPIDTENINDKQLSTIQSLANEACATYGPLHAIVSTDGDSDRPLILGVEAGTPCKVQFFGGDLVGMIVAEYLDADAVIVPISCNDAIDRGALKNKVEPKTRIGSPYVIAGMMKAKDKGRRVICGWEANGGFLTGSGFEHNGRTLRALPTRDAMLPILSVLYSMTEKNLSMAELFAGLPKRFSKASLLENFPRAVSLQIIDKFSPKDSEVKEVRFEKKFITFLDGDNHRISADDTLRQSIISIHSELKKVFTPEKGFGEIAKINYIDGIRVYFSNQDVAHVRPSGNADELRIYAVADSQKRADAIASMGVAEPDGLLRQLEAMVKK